MAIRRIWPLTEKCPCGRTFIGPPSGVKATGQCWRCRAVQPPGLQSPGEFIEALAKGSLVSLDTAIQSMEADMMRRQNSVRSPYEERVYLDWSRCR